CPAVAADTEKPSARIQGLYGQLRDNPHSARPAARPPHLTRLARTHRAGAAHSSSAAQPATTKKTTTGTLPPLVRQRSAHPGQHPQRSRTPGGTPYADRAPPRPRSNPARATGRPCTLSRAPDGPPAGAGHEPPTAAR